MYLRRGYVPDPATPDGRREMANGYQILSKGTKAVLLDLI